MSKGGAIERIDQILVQVSDMERSLRFYRDALGIPFEPTDYGDDSHVVRLGETRLLLHPDFHDFAGASRGAGILLHLRVADVDAFCDELRERGIAIAREPRDIYQDRIAGVVDPDGYSIQISSPIAGR